MVTQMYGNVNLLVMQIDRYVILILALLHLKTTVPLLHRGCI